MSVFVSVFAGQVNIVQLQLLLPETSAHVCALVLQLRLRVEVMLFFGLCLVLLWLVRLGSCASYEFVGLGIMPMQVRAHLH